MNDTIMDLERIYRYRFIGIDQKRRIAVWHHITNWVMNRLGHPEKMLEVGAGRCEFINQCKAQEKWALDSNPIIRKYTAPDVIALIGKIQDINFENERFDAIFMSNFLEHLTSLGEIHEALEICFYLLKKGGRVGILGPNFKYAWRDYYNCVDHIMPLTHLTVAEYLVGIGFNDLKILPKFLPYSFRSNQLNHPYLVKIYLSLPLAWKIMGKQFFIIANKS